MHFLSGLTKGLTPIINVDTMFQYVMIGFVHSHQYSTSGQAIFSASNSLESEAGSSTGPAQRLGGIHRAGSELCIMAA